MKSLAAKNAEHSFFFCCRSLLTPRQPLLMLVLSKSQNISYSSSDTVELLGKSNFLLFSFTTTTTTTIPLFAAADSRRRPQFSPRYPIFAEAVAAAATPLSPIQCQSCTTRRRRRRRQRCCGNAAQDQRGQLKRNPLLYPIKHENCLGTFWRGLAFFRLLVVVQIRRSLKVWS